MLRRRPSRYHVLTLITAALCLAALVTAPPPLSLALVGSLLLTHIALSALGVARPRWEFFAPITCHVKTHRRAVALTFDDGPSPDTTPLLLDVLQRRQTPATFFWVGQRVAQYPDLARRAAAEGHQIENHSWTHHPGTNLFTAARLRADLQRTQDAIRTATGRAPMWFRPPMGLTNPRVASVTRKLRLPLVGWSARGRDQFETDPNRIVERLTLNLQPGAILLLHDAGLPVDRLLAVADMLVDKLHAAGYECLRLDDLIASTSTTCPAAVPSPIL